MREETLYSFFCAKNIDTCFKVLEIEIDQSLKTIYNIYYHVGREVYNNQPYENSINPSDKYFFGASPDGFRDCLMDYLEIRETNISLRLNIKSVGENIVDKEIYMFLYILATCMLDFNFDSRLQVYVSKEILNIYLKEAERLLVLDTNPDDPNDYVQY